MEFLRNALYLSTNCPLCLIGMLVFFLLGLWMAYLLWYVAAKREKDRSSLHAASPGIDPSAEESTASRAIDSGTHAGGPSSDSEESADDLTDETGTTGSNSDDPLDDEPPTGSSHPFDRETVVAAEYADENGVRIDPELGILYDVDPNTADDLKMIKGVGPGIEGQLHDFGVYRFKQIAHWAPGNVDAFNRELNFKGRIERDEWIPQAVVLAGLARALESDRVEAPAEVDHAAVAAASFPGEAVGIDPALGIVFTDPPLSGSDDLTRIAGITPEIETTLNARGIYYHAQIASWSDHNVAGFASILGMEKSELERLKWTALATKEHRATYAASSQWPVARPTIGDYEAFAASDFAGEAVRADADLGVVYCGEPGHRDPLQTIKGVGPVLEKSLHEAGVHCYKQIAGWSEANVEAFAKKLSCFPGRIYRDRWISQASDLPCQPAVLPTESIGITDATHATHAPQLLEEEFAGEPTRFDEKLGILYTDAPPIIDDLKRIKGVGPVLEAELNEYGVYRFKQIALWTDENAREFSTELGVFKDRIFRDNWIAQAAAFAKEPQA